jgi:hypothetical protein
LIELMKGTRIVGREVEHASDVIYCSACDMMGSCAPGVTTLKALADRGLVIISKDEWIITQAGRALVLVSAEWEEYERQREREKESYAQKLAYAALIGTTDYAKGFADAWRMFTQDHKCERYGHHYKDCLAISLYEAARGEESTDYVGEDVTLRS